METLEDFAAAVHNFAAVLDTVPAGTWEAPTLCEGWTRADVVDHVVDTQRQALERYGATLSDEPTFADPAERFAAHAGVILPTLEQRWSHDIEGFFGPSTVAETMLTFYGLDLLIHRLDISWGTSFHVDLTPTQVAWVRTTLEGFGESMRMPEVFGPEVVVAGGADPQVALLAFSGRRVA